MGLGDKGQAMLARSQKGLGEADTLAEQFGTLSKADKDLSRLAKGADEATTAKIGELRGQLADALHSEPLFGPAAQWHAQTQGALDAYQAARAEAKASLMGKAEVPLEQQRAAAQAYVDKSKALLDTLDKGTYEALGREGGVVPEKLAADLDTLHSQAGRLAAPEGGHGMGLLHASVLHGLLPHGASAVLRTVAAPLSLGLGALKLLQGGHSETIAKIASKAASATKAIAKGVRDWGAGRAVEAVGVGSRDFAKASESVQQAASQGVGAMPTLARHAPQIEQAVRATATAGATYLAKAAPKDTRPQGMVPNSKFQPSESALQTWWSQVDAVTHPATLLASLSTGQVTPAQVDALKTVHPEQYNQMCQHVMDEVAKHGDKMTPGQLSAAAIFLGQPVSAEQKQAPQIQALYEIGRAHV